MAKHTDEQLSQALIHDANALTEGGEDDAMERHDKVRARLTLAEVLVSGKAEDEDRAAVYKLDLHPSTVSHYLR